MRLVTTRISIFVVLCLAIARFAHGSAWTEGQKSLLYIRVDFSDLPGDPVSTKELADTLAKVETYLRENSYGRYILKTKFTPTLRMPRPALFYEGNPDQQAIINDARSAAKKIGFDTAYFTLDIVAFKTLHGGDSELAAIGAKGARILNNFRLGITLHAIGHNLGLPHSSFWRTNDGTIIGAGVREEYGDPYDPMGGGGGYDETLKRHFVVRSKALLGWLTDAQITHIKSSGSYRLFPQDQPGNGPKAIVIERDAKTKYWLEFRRLIDDPRSQNGIRILRSFNDQNAVELLSMSPNSPNGQADAPLLLGQTFAIRRRGYPSRRRESTKHSIRRA